MLLTHSHYVRYGRLGSLEGSRMTEDARLVLHRHLDGELPHTHQPTDLPCAQGSPMVRVVSGDPVTRYRGSRLGTEAQHREGCECAPS